MRPPRELLSRSFAHPYASHRYDYNEADTHTREVIDKKGWWSFYRGAGYVAVGSLVAGSVSGDVALAGIGLSFLAAGIDGNVTSGQIDSQLQAKGIQPIE